MYGLDKDVARERTAELLDFMGLANERKKLIADFSHGMGKKLALAAAVIHGPRVLFLDEPFEGVDAIAAGTLKSMLQGMIARGATIFLTSHVLEIVERLCSHVAIMRRGRIVAQGSLDELRAGVRTQLAASRADTDVATGDALSERLTLEQIFLSVVGEDGGTAHHRGGALMARVSGGRIAALMPERWRGAQTLAQFRAIAWLRWRILANGFRRKGGAGELAARLVIYPIMAAFALLPTVGAGVGGYLFARDGQLPRISWLLWATFIVCQLLNINLGQPGTTFDPNLLIRFPLRLRSFIAIRLFFGLLSPANVLGTMMALAIALGVTIALPELWLYAFIGLAVFAAANVLFSRMVFAWVDRWLATRRAREIFTALIFAGSLGFQFLNVAVQPCIQPWPSRRRARQASRDRSSPGTSDASAAGLSSAAAYGIIAGRRPSPDSMAGFAGLTVACALFSAVFLLVFGLRMRTEFRGENLSDAANAVGPARRAAKAAHPNTLSAASATRMPQALSFRSTVSAVLAQGASLRPPQHRPVLQPDCARSDGLSLRGTPGDTQFQCLDLSRGARVHAARHRSAQL